MSKACGDLGVSGPCAVHGRRLPYVFVIRTYCQEFRNRANILAYSMVFSGKDHSVRMGAIATSTAIAILASIAAGSAADGNGQNGAPGRAAMGRTAPPGKGGRMRTRRSAFQTVQLKTITLL